MYVVPVDSIKLASLFRYPFPYDMMESRNPAIRDIIGRLKQGACENM